MRAGSIPLLLMLSLALTGCASHKRAPTPELHDFDVTSWPDAVRLSNGTAVAIVVPSIGGRIMKYGLSESDFNVLWTNDALRPRRDDEWPEDRRRAESHAAAGATTKPSWKDWGGEKVYPWPRDEWPLRLGRTWPPPAELDQQPMKARLVSSLAVRMESAPIRGYGVKLVREISLAPTGTRLTIVSRFEPTSVDLPPVELAAWDLTQLPAHGRLFARLTARRTIQPLPPADRPTTRPTAPGTASVVSIEPPPAGGVGLDADVLAWTADEMLWIARAALSPRDSKRIRAGEGASVFVRPAPGEAKAPPSVELSFTSARNDLARGQSPELTVTWELFRQELTTWKDADVARLMMAQ